MLFNLVLPKLELYAPIAVIAFTLLLIVFAEVAGKLRVTQARSPRRLWIELIALAIALAVLIVLFDWWLAGRLSPATLSVLTWGTVV